MLNFSDLKDHSIEEIYQKSEAVHQWCTQKIFDYSIEEAVWPLVGSHNPPKTVIGSNVVARAEVACGCTTSVNALLSNNPKIQVLLVQLRSSEWITDTLHPIVDQLKIKKHLRLINKMNLDGFSLTDVIADTDDNGESVIGYKVTLALWGEGIHARKDQIRNRLAVGLRSVPTGRNVQCLLINGPTETAAAMCTMFSTAFGYDLEKSPKKQETPSDDDLLLQLRLMHVRAVTSLKSLTIGFNDGNAVLRGAFATCDARLRASKDKPIIHRDCIQYEVSRMGRSFSKKYHLPRVIVR